MPSPALAISSRLRAQTQGPSSCAKNRLRADVSSPISTLVQLQSNQMMLMRCVMMRDRRLQRE